MVQLYLWFLFYSFPFFQIQNHTKNEGKHSFDPRMKLTHNLYIQLASYDYSPPIVPKINRAVIKRLAIFATNPARGALPYLAEKGTAVCAAEQGMVFRVQGIQFHYLMS